VLNKIYGTTALPGERSLRSMAKGPTRRDPTPGGTRVSVNVILSGRKQEGLSIPSGQYGFLNATDGGPAPAGPVSRRRGLPTVESSTMLDAEYFLTHGGQPRTADECPDDG